MEGAAIKKLAVKGGKVGQAWWRGKPRSSPQLFDKGSLEEIANRKDGLEEWLLDRAWKGTPRGSGCFFGQRTFVWRTEPGSRRWLGAGTAFFYPS